MKKVTWSMVAALVLGCGGCSWQSMRSGRMAQPSPADESAPAPVAQAPKAPDGPTPVEQALELSRKLDICKKQLEEARAENKTLTERNVQLTSQSAQSTMELSQARKELDEANAMLREMQNELAKWKADVLGFRQEMRNAQGAQLDALRRVLRVLGAEEPPAPTAAKPAADGKGSAATNAPTTQPAGPVAAAAGASQS